MCQVFLLSTKIEQNCLQLDMFYGGGEGGGADNVQAEDMADAQLGQEGGAAGLHPSHIHQRQHLCSGIRYFLTVTNAYSLPACPSICLSFHLSVLPSVCLSFHLPVLPLSFRLSFRLTFCPLISPSFHLSVCPSKSNQVLCPYVSPA